MSSQALAQTFERAVALHKQGRLDEAERIYRSILKALPDQADALHLLGVASAQRLDFKEAVKYFKRALKGNPRWPEALCNMGNALRALRRPEEAVVAYRKALDIDPRHGETLYCFGVILGELSRHEEAVRLLERAVAGNPGDVQALCVMAMSLSQLGRHEEGVVAARKAAATRPDFPPAHNNLGVILNALGRREEAETCLRTAIELAGSDPDAYSNLGLVLVANGRVEEGVACYQQALAIDPGFDKAHNNLGNALVKLNRHSEAIESLQRALAISPDYANAEANLGAAFTALGRYEEAMVHLRRALALKPDHVEAGSHLIFTLDFIPSTTFETHAAACRDWYQRHARTLAASIKPHANLRDPARKLRVGYVSADFREHSAAMVFGPVIRHHDRAQFDVVLYSGVGREDSRTLEFQRSASLWRPILGLSDQTLAERIRDDGIDILVDLSAFSDGNRLLAFARKPAPVQVTAWGDAVSTGLPAIDYHFSDAVVVPAEARQYCTETVIDLPCCLAFDPPREAPDEAPAPSLLGEPVTFGCLNRLAKMSELSVRLWTQLLQRSPGSRLLLKDHRLADPVEQARVTRMYAAGGIERDRLVLLPGTSRAEHLGAYGRVDVVLDPAPHTGGVSTLEALWMGVPVITLLGENFPGRISGSILSVLGLQAWIARSADAYVELAACVAADADGRARMRKMLRPMLRDSVICDGTRYCRAVEAAYRDMWVRYCAAAGPR